MEKEYRKVIYINLIYENPLSITRCTKTKSTHLYRYIKKSDVCKSELEAWTDWTLNSTIILHVLAAEHMYSKIDCGWIDMATNSLIAIEVKWFGLHTFRRSSVQTKVLNISLSYSIHSSVRPTRRQKIEILVAHSFCRAPNDFITWCLLDEDVQFIFINHNFCFESKCET